MGLFQRLDDDEASWSGISTDIAYDPELVPNPNAGEPLYETNETGDPIPDPATIRPTMGPDGLPAIV